MTDNDQFLVFVYNREPKTKTKNYNTNKVSSIPNTLVCWDIHHFTILLNTIVRPIFVLQKLTQKLTQKTTNILRATSFGMTIQKLTHIYTQLVVMIGNSFGSSFGSSFGRIFFCFLLNEVIFSVTTFIWEIFPLAYPYIPTLTRSNKTGNKEFAKGCYRRSSSRKSAKGITKGAKGNL